MDFETLTISPPQTIKQFKMANFNHTPESKPVHAFCEVVKPLNLITS